ncbi:MAG: GMC oxidoreductase [Bosea sp. (in: a-proteobacteria)]|nr:GMC oxidoreductase [Bosea sp. (in: a-proteobacteria)]
MRPRSRGSIHIASPRPQDAPAIRPNFLSDRVDQEELIGGGVAHC